MVVFVAGLAGLTWYVRGQSDSDTTSAAGTGALYALPPADARNLQVIYPEEPPFEDMGSFIYDDPTLGTVQLYTTLNSTTGFTDAETDLQGVGDRGFDALSTEAPGFGTVAIVCAPPSASGATGEDGVMVAIDGQAMIRWYGDGISTTLSQERVAGPCTVNATAPGLVRAMTSVRLVDRAEWQQFIAQNRTSEVPGPTTDIDTKPGPESWCESVEAIRSSGTIDATTGRLQIGALPHLREMLSEAPPEVAPPIEVLIAWLEDGAPTPVPDEVIAAEDTSTQDWVVRCPAG
jgi:hypothetical protein